MNDTVNVAYTPKLHVGMANKKLTEKRTKSEEATMTRTMDWLA